MRPIIQTFPRIDGEFNRHVTSLASGLESPPALQTALRETYPDAAVSDGVADRSGRPVWYVYRDGSWAKTKH